MPRRTSLPNNASFATADEGDKLFAPSAARNLAPLTDALAAIAPQSGTAMEIASGTGQHIISYAAAMPTLLWHPTEIDPDRLASIAAYVAEADLDNIAQPQMLDATTPGWGNTQQPIDFIVLSNLLHLISQPEVEVLISEASAALAPSGILAIYGPFMRGNVFASDGDQSFHESLQASDPHIGYKSNDDILALGAACQLSVKDAIAMPANNLLLHWQK